MATYIERREGRTRSVDAHNQRIGSRSFFVDVPDPAAAIATVVAGEGGINSQFPGDSGLIVDSIQHQPDSAGAGSEVVYNYSTNRRFTMSTKVDKDKAGYYTWSSSWSIVTKKVPFARKIRKTIASGNTAVSTDVWELAESESVYLPAQVVTVNCTVSDWGPDESATVDSLIGQLHVPAGSGVQYLFEGAIVARRGDALYDVTYNYKSDPVLPARDNTDASIVRPNVNLQPWFDWAIKPSIDPTTTPPTFIPVSRKYVANDNGHLSLPGWPL